MKAVTADCQSELNPHGFQEACLLMCRKPVLLKNLSATSRLAELSSSGHPPGVRTAQCHSDGTCIWVKRMSSELGMILAVHLSWALYWEAVPYAEATLKIPIRRFSCRSINQRRQRPRRDQTAHRLGPAG